MTVYRDHGRKRGDSMDKLNSRVFYKMYLTNTVLMVVFVGILALISSHFSSKFVLDKITDFNRQTIEDRGEVLEDKLRQMNDLSDAAVASDEVIRLMLTEKDQYISPLVMQEIIQDLKIIRDNYTLVDEISLVDYEREMVINSQSKLSLRETIYRDAIDWEPLSFHSDSGRVSILYTKNWRPVQREADFSIVLEINQEAFQENLFIPFEDLREYVVTGDGAILSEAGLVEELQDGWEQIEGEEYGNAAAGLTAYVHQINGGGGSVAGVWDNAQLRKEAGSIVYKTIGICVAIIAIASLILYFSALSFYKPLRKLKERVSEMKPAGKGEVGRNPDKKENNEFQFIESAIHSLQDEKQQIKEKYEESVPVITQNVSSRLITEGYEEEAFSHLLGVLGYEMRGSQYVLLIAECKNRGEIHALGERLNELIRKDGMEALYFEKNVGQGTFLINTDLPYKNFIEQVEMWKQETSKVVSTWCLSDYFANRSNMNLVYWETVERLKKKFFKEENAIIYGTSAKEEKEGQVSNIKIEQKLLACIKEGKDGESEEILHDFTRELSNTQLEIQYTVFIYFSICSKLIQDLKSFDVALSKEYDEKAVFQELFQGENIYDLEKTTLKVIRTLAEKFQEKEPVHSASVKKAIEFIEENYHRDLTLEDIANEVYLTTIYLSNLFKKETGCTVMEYVTRLRMKEARELLSQSPAIKIKDIAERLGYRNVQSFIRYFKIYYGVTPVEFRRNRKHETHGGKDDQ